MIIDLAGRAQAFAGTPFRAQGRDPATGLDCLGLIIAAGGLPADAGRRDYRLRGDHRAKLMRGLLPWFRRVSRPRRRPGDVLVLRSGAEQVHLAVLTERGFVHADARIGRVVETPGLPRWPLVAVFRRRVRARRQGQG